MSVAAHRLGGMLMFEGSSEGLGFGEVLGVGIVGDEGLGFGEVLGFAVGAAGDEVRTLELDGAALVAALVAVRMVAGALVVVGATELGTAVVPAVVPAGDAVVEDGDAVVPAGDAVVEDPVQPATDVQSSTPVTVNSQRR